MFRVQNLALQSCVGNEGMVEHDEMGNSPSRADGDHEEDAETETKNRGDQMKKK